MLAPILETRPSEAFQKAGGSRGEHTSMDDSVSLGLYELKLEAVDKDQQAAVTIPDRVLNIVQRRPETLEDDSGIFWRKLDS